MHLTQKDTNMLKGLAMIFLLWLHLFNTKDYVGLFEPIIIIGQTPLVYYISLLSGCCVSIYLFCSGYGLAMSSKEGKLSFKHNIKRIFKLLLNYWIILILFVGLGILLKDSRYPGSIKEFLLKFFLLSKSYNGAWWFLQSYVLLVLMSPVLVRFIKNHNSKLIFLGTGILYFLAFIVGIRGNISIDNELALMIYQMMLNLSSCLFSFVLGVIFVKENIIGKIYEVLKTGKRRRVLGAIGIIIIMIINIIVENFIIDPITAVAVIISFKLLEPGKAIEKILVFFSKHSTNIWLTHMFFYMIFFKDWVFSPKYPLLILGWLIVLCVGTSYIINFIYNCVLKIISSFTCSVNKVIANEY